MPSEETTYERRYPGQARVHANVQSLEIILEDDKDNKDFGFIQRCCIAAFLPLLHCK